MLAEVGRALGTFGRLVLCHIVRVEGSTPGKPGWRMMVRPDGSAYGNLGGGSFEALVKADAAVKLGPAGGGSEVKRYYLTERAVRGEATGMVCGGLAEVFLEVMKAPPLLVLCGGGPVGQAVAWAARSAGFEVLVAEDREEFRAPDLFPEGTVTVAVDRGYREDFLAPVSARELFVAVVTRCWETDTAALASVLRQAPPHLAYLGLMGSRRKVERVRAEVERQGFGVEGAAAGRFHAPIGLPIGGDTPGEIAVGIVAELIQERYRGGNPEDSTESSEEKVVGAAETGEPLLQR